MVESAGEEVPGSRGQSAGRALLLTPSSESASSISPEAGAQDSCSGICLLFGFAPRAHRGVSGRATPTQKSGPGAGADNKMEQLTPAATGRVCAKPPGVLLHHLLKGRAVAHGVEPLSGRRGEEVAVPEAQPCHRGAGGCGTLSDLSSPPYCRLHRRTKGEIQAACRGSNCPRGTQATDGTSLGRRSVSGNGGPGEHWAPAGPRAGGGVQSLVPKPTASLQSGSPSAQQR
jgi:hypothetical protein